MSSALRGLALAAALSLAGTTLAGCGGQVAPERAQQVASRTVTPAPTAKPSARSSATTSATTSAGPLAGLVIALDPGHQLGNHNFPRQTNAPVQAGGFTKPCNTTGTATNSGVAEATVNWQLARAVKRRLVALGATVAMTRSSNSESLWGPCVDARGRFGKRVGAALTVSLHADGAASSAHGFHVIAPTRRAPWTTDISGRSWRLAHTLRDGLTSYGVPRSSYIGGGTGLDRRTDLGTLNMSDVPVAMIEIGNMRNAGDAARMTSASGRSTYAAGVVAGIRAYLRR